MAKSKNANENQKFTHCRFIFWSVNTDMSSNNKIFIKSLLEILLIYTMNFHIECLLDSFYWNLLYTQCKLCIVEKSILVSDIILKFVNTLFRYTKLFI